MYLNSQDWESYDGKTQAEVKYGANYIRECGFLQEDGCGSLKIISTYASTGQKGRRRKVASNCHSY